MSLVACDPAPLEVVVVDGDKNRSAESVTTDVAGGTDIPVRYFHSEPGLTRQRNLALRNITGSVVAFFDDDATVAADVFTHLAAAYEDATVVGATGRVIEPVDHAVGGRTSSVRRLLLGGRPGTFTRFGYPRRYNAAVEPLDVEFMQGCFMTARADLAATVGFDERLPGYGLAEDEDFSCRLSRMGRLRYLPAAVVHHDNTGFATRDARRFGRQVVVNRSHLFRKNFPQSALARSCFWLMIAVLYVHRAVNRDWAGARGLIDGVREVWSAS